MWGRLGGAAQVPGDDPNAARYSHIGTPCERLITIAH